MSVEDWKRTVDGSASVPSTPCRLPILLGLVLLTAGCLHRHRGAGGLSRQAPAPSLPPLPAPPGATPPSGPVPVEQGEEGLASWYGYPYHGRPTASGEIYNMYDLTAAHRTLAFGTQVKVHDLDNGHDVTVRINDRGPFVEGRIIDLSYAAAQALRMVGPGTALVRLEFIGVPLPSEPGIYAVQVGAFRDRSNAERLQALIASRFGPVMIQSFDRGDGLFHRVRVGQEPTEDAARDLARELREANLAAETFVVRLN